jgi:tetratricopeptide (TPR) repeat protein
VSLSARVLLGVVAAAALSAACARPPVPRPPETADFLFPVAAPGELTPDEARQIDRAWRDLMAGEVPDAEKTFQKLAGRKPDLVPAQTGLAYARLKLGRLPEAAAGFARALKVRPDYVPALVGAGATAQKQQNAEAALDFYRSALAVQPSDPALRKRVAEIKIQITEKRVAEAHAALEAGDSARAEQRYRQALEAAPEVAGVRLQLADLLEGAGDSSAAADVLEADPSEDHAVLSRLGTLLMGQKQYERALDAWRRILARDSRDAEALKRSREAIAAIEFAKMPEEYQRIPGAPRISRAELAALISVKVPQLEKVAARTPKVAIDISGSWAREHILSILSLDIMDVYPNHSFQPGAIVRRGDLARAAARVLDLFRVRGGSGAAPTDMARANLYYDAALRLTGVGLMGVTPEGAFEPWRPVSGQEAVEVISGVARLVGS